MAEQLTTLHAMPGALGLTVALETKGELAIAVHRNGNHSQGRGNLRPPSVPETRPRENQRDIPWAIA